MKSLNEILEYTFEEKGNCIILILKGTLNIATVKRLEDAALKMIAEGKNKFIIDFKELAFIDSRGLEFFIFLYKKLASVKGTYVVVNLKGFIKDLFDITMVSSQFKIFESIEEALASLK